MSPRLDPAALFGPAPTGIKGALGAFALARLPFVFRLLRRAWPIVKFRKTVVATRYDDVREVFATDEAFGVPYAPQLDVIMGGQPFFLGMGDTPLYRSDTAAMRKVVRIEDVPASIGPAVSAMAERIVDEAGGRIDVVDSLVRRVTFGVLADYFGITDPPGGDLRIWGTQLFRYQFVDSTDPELVRQVNVIAPKLRDHIQSLIEARRAAGAGPDNVLGRCIEMQAKGEPGFSDDQIRTSLMGFIVGGPPQPPMVVPKALDQLLRRPDILAEAQAAARADQDELLFGYVFEAMRFDPLTPALPRIALADHMLAAGTSRATMVPKGSNIVAAISSAMMDGRRVPNPDRFNPHRAAYEYMHFGHGLHECFGRHINRGTFQLMLKPLLKRLNLRRSPGKSGRLVRQGPFPVSLFVDYD